MGNLIDVGAQARNIAPKAVEFLRDLYSNRLLQQPVACIIAQRKPCAYGVDFSSFQLIG